MRNIVVGAAAAAALSVGAVGQAAAADLIIAAPAPVVDEAGADLYFKIYGGVTATNSMWSDDDYDSEFDPSWMVGGSVGVVVMPNLSLELDINGGSSDDVADLTLSSLGLFLNAVVEVPVGDTFAAYVGGGVGGVRLTYDGDSGMGAAGQVFAGVSVGVTDNVSLFGEVRYQAGFGPIDIDYWGEVDYGRAAALVGLKFSN